MTKLLRDHLTKFGTTPDGRLLGGVRGELPTITYRRAWIKARQAVLTAAEASLAARPVTVRPAACAHPSSELRDADRAAEGRGEGDEHDQGRGESGERHEEDQPGYDRAS